MTPSEHKSIIIEDMMAYNQTQNQTIYQHGESVWEYAKKICSYQLDGMKLPDWFKGNFFQIINQIVPYSTLKNYCIFHDCGKPYCHEVDGEGRTHFPNHAEVSSEKYKLMFPDDEDGTWLVRHDMALHTYSANEIAELCRSTKKELMLTLIISAFAELHSNASMFGGIDSTSFKIKWKRVNQRSKQIIKHFGIDDNSSEKYYSYIILRKDMDNAHKCVQASHAAMEHSGYGGENHPSIICVEVKNENKLKSTISKMIENGIDFKLFREGAGVHEDEITAICTAPIKHDSSEREFFRRFQLLK